MRSPKLDPVSGEGRPTPGSRYYAGYNAGFVEDVLQTLSLRPGSVVLDPWNGAGTTTTVARHQGHRAVGIDINPVLVVVAKARLMGSYVAESLPALGADILAKARGDDMRATAGDPLLQWFAPGTGAYLRAIERATCRLLVDPAAPTGALDTNKLSGLAAWYYVVLFEVVRSFLGAFTTTNPTWIKTKGADEVATSLSKDQVDSRFRARLEALRTQLIDIPAERRDQLATITVGSSERLNLENNAVDAIISSPPYCTRIDYAVLTRPELAVLGIEQGQELTQLRRSMIGGPSMRPHSGDLTGVWGTAARRFLGQVKAHPSKASATYYLRYYLQYFEAMATSLSEIRRVLKPGGSSALVVQDSFYKEIHNDLPTIVQEMILLAGFDTIERHDFAVQRTMAALHPGTRKYRRSFGATESLILAS